jgi:hypothetical protein
MKYIITYLSVCFISLCLHGQINLELKMKLDSIQNLDQAIRIEVRNVMSNTEYLDSLSQTNGFVLSDYVKNLMLKQESFDRANLIFIDSIVNKFGYPGKSMVGESTAQIAWLIIQHSYNIDDYYKVILKASKKGEIPDSLFAKTKDRCRINHGKKQIYGTQTECFPNHAGSFDCYISPIQNTIKVNKRRKKVGFYTTIEEYAQMNGYRIRNKNNRK